jgi:hypothetical protein
MGAIYRLCSVALSPLVRPEITRETHVCGFGFSVVRDSRGLRTLFTKAVWGDPEPSEPRFPRLVAHRPKRVQELHRELARAWRSERASYVAPRGDDYDEWFVGEFENVLELYREAHERRDWITNDPDLLGKTLGPTRLLQIGQADQVGPQAFVGVVGLVALGALGRATWRDRPLATRRSRRSSE